MNLAFFTPMFSSVLSSFSGWDWLSIIGPLLVVAGLAGELWLVYENSPFNPNRPPPLSVKHFKIERRSVVLVALGVALELATVPHSLMEVAALSKEVQDLRAKNDALEFKAQDRTTTPEQMAIFKRILQNAPKGPIMLGTRHPNHETVKYENKIEDMLTNSGFTIQSMINYGNNILTMNEGSSVALVIESQTNAPKFTFLLEQAFKAAGIETTGFVNPPVNVFGNEPRPGSNEILVLVVEKP